MILDDLFEGDLPPHIKKTDLPPGMRPRLTMRDVEAERPRSVFRYRVGDSDFMDIRAAQEFAQGTGQKVQQIAEQGGETDPNVLRGMTNLKAIADTADDNTKVEIKTETGRAKHYADEPAVKKFILDKANDMAKRGLTRQLYYGLGTEKGFEKLWAVWTGEAELTSQVPQRSDVGRPAQPDLFTSKDDDAIPTGQAGSPRSRRFLDRFREDQKKRPDLEEQESARTQRMIDKIRARQPQAQTDIEALIYDVEDQQARDRRDIERLEKQRDELEQDVRSGLEQEIEKLQQRRGRAGELAAVSGRDQAQDQAIAKIIQLDREQQQAIDSLARSMGGRARAGRAVDYTPTAPTAPTVPAAAAEPARKLQQPALGQVAQAGGPAANEPEQQALRLVAEKKKPVPTNPGLWGRAKSAARSKFDVYPSAYANAWAAKWYKSKGGGWRMGKPKKK